jgi:thiol-disulfide isomerase/thioredoxin
MLKNWKTIALGVFVIAALAVVAYVAFGGRPTVQGFKNLGQVPNEPTFTMYYAPWCGHCKRAMPDFDEFMKSSPMDIAGQKCVIRKVDPEAQPDVAAGKPIKGFPTFLLETPDGKIVEYQGERSTAGYLEFLNKSLGGGAI